MIGKTINHLNSLMETLSYLQENKMEKMLQSCDNENLRQDIRTELIDSMENLMQKIEIILEGIENGEYDDGSEPLYDFQ